jgi:hypothetical protein
MNALFVLQPGNAELEPRRGDPPLTTRPNREQPFPHQQLTQTVPGLPRRSLYWFRECLLTSVNVGNIERY